MEVKGLILLGGQSSRMQLPKHLIEYHNKPQYLYLHELLSTICDEVFISNSIEQTLDISTIKNITDNANFSGNGPISGMLSSLNTLHSSIFVVPCDCPYINRNTLEQLFENRNPNKLATVYKNSETGITEPLLGIYEKHALPELLDWFVRGNYSLRHFLDSHSTEYVMPLSNSELISVDTPEEMEKAILFLKSMR